MSTPLITPLRLKALFWGLLVLALSVVVYRYYVTSGVYKDPTLRAAITKVRAIHSYRQTVETQVEFPTRSLHISGVYDVDTTHGNYRSVSTTTLSLPGQPQGAIFTQANISIGKDVYTQIDTTSRELKNTIPATSTWQHFTENAIPSIYSGIAIAGPILDNLRIFDRSGMYLIQNGLPVSVQWGTESMHRYSFKIDPESLQETSGTLGALFGRITATGSIDVWIDASNDIRHLRFENASYHSTTSLSRINEDLQILPPPSQ